MAARTPRGKSPVSAASPRRAALYLRVSLDATGEGLAIDRQRESCLSILASRGWTMTGEYVDNSISATNARKKRPGYDALVADFKAGKFDAVVCYDLDRLTRQPRQLEDWIDNAETGSLALVTANGEADLTTDAGRLFARIKLAVARSEVERKSARQRDAARQRSNIGRPPLGVRLTGYTPQGELVPEEAQTIRRIFAEFLAGATLKGIARGLTADGVATRRGATWNPSSIRTILTNPRYAGRAIYRGEETGERGAWVAIISDEDFTATQAILGRPDRRLQETTERKHLGSGLYLCAVCEEPVSAWSGARYRCRNGAHVNRSRGPVDQFVEAVLRKRLSEPDLADLMTSSDDRTAPFLGEIEKQKRLLRRAEDDYQAEVIDGPLYKRTRDDARVALKAAEDSLAAVLSSSATRAVLGARDPAAAYDASDLMTQRAVIDFFMTVRLRPGVKYSKTFDPQTVEIDWRTP